MAASDAEKAAEALSNAPVAEFALKASQLNADIIAMIGQRNLDQRAGGGRWPRGLGTVISTQTGPDKWAAALLTPFMGMEWGGYVTNIWGNPFGTRKTGEAQLKPMWAPFHKEYQKGYIIGAAWTALNEGKATEDMADQVLNAYRKAFDQAGLPNG